jgi:hypothetical protein
VRSAVEWNETRIGRGPVRLDMRRAAVRISDGSTCILHASFRTAQTDLMVSSRETVADSDPSSVVSVTLSANVSVTPEIMMLLLLDACSSTLILNSRSLLIFFSLLFSSATVAS